MDVESLDECVVLRIESAIRLHIICEALPLVNLARERNILIREDKLQRLEIWAGVVSLLVEVAEGKPRSYSCGVEANGLMEGLQCQIVLTCCAINLGKHKVVCCDVWSLLDSLACTRYGGLSLSRLQEKILSQILLPEVATEVLLGQIQHLQRLRCAVGAVEQNSQDAVVVWFGDVGDNLLVDWHSLLVLLAVNQCLGIGDEVVTVGGIGEIGSLGVLDQLLRLSCQTSKEVVGRRIGRIPTYDGLQSRLGTQGVAMDGCVLDSLGVELCYSALLALLA